MVFWTILFVYLATKASYQGTIFEMENTISYQETGNVCQETGVANWGSVAS